MKTLILSGLVLFCTMQAIAQDTIRVTLKDLRSQKEMAIKVKKGAVIEFKTKGKDKLNKSIIRFKFWQNEDDKEGQSNAYLYSRGKIAFGYRDINKNIHVISPVTGIIEVKLKSYWGIWAGTMAGIMVVVYVFLF